LGYFVSVTFFSHSHEIRGEKITHSHLFNPFSESKTQHTHTENEFLFIAVLSHLIAYVGVAIVLYDAFVKSNDYFKLGKITHTISVFYFFESNGLRAPPRK
jgi:hypothetical protein